MSDNEIAEIARNNVASIHTAMRATRNYYPVREVNYQGLPAYEVEGWYDGSGRIRVFNHCGINGSSERPRSHYFGSKFIFGRNPEGDRILERQSTWAPGGYDAYGTPLHLSKDSFEVLAMTVKLYNREF